MSVEIVEFVSYGGKYPALCCGTLRLKINGQPVTMTNILISGGKVWFDENMLDHVEKGDWIIENLPERFEPYRKEIEEVVNKNVPKGCCGGCV